MKKKMTSKQARQAFIEWSNKYTKIFNDLEVEREEAYRKAMLKYWDTIHGQ